MTSLVRRNGGLFDSTFDDIFSMRENALFPIEQHFNQIFDQFFSKGTLESVKSKCGYPKLEIGIEDNYWVVRAAIPGLGSNDIKVEVLPDRKLRISGQMSEEYRSPEGSKYWIKELKKSHFMREVQIPKEVEGDPEATMKDGMLTLKWELPQINRAPPETKTIEVKPG